MRKIIPLILVFTLFLFSAETKKSQIHKSTIDNTLSYQGVLRDDDGYLSGNYTLIFKLYDTQTGTTSLWTETKNVSLDNGVFNVILGSSTPLDLDFQDQYYLGIAIQGEDEFTPRVKLTTAPYAIMAKSIEDGAVTSQTIADGQVVKSINGKTDDINVVAGNNININENGNTVTISADLSTAGDNLGDHTATENIKLGTNWVSSDGDNEGLQVESDGDVFVSKNLNVQENIQAESFSGDGSNLSGIVDEKVKVGTNGQAGYLDPEDFEASTVFAKEKTLTEGKENNTRATISIKDGAVTSDKIADGAVTSEKIGSGTIVTDNLANASVETDKVKNSAITTNKIADGAVTSEKIATSTLVKSVNGVQDEVNLTAGNGIAIENSKDGNIQISADLNGSYYTKPEIDTKFSERDAIISENSTNIATNTQGVAQNRGQIVTNLGQIQSNSTALQSNTTLIGQNQSNIAVNAQDIDDNRTSIDGNASQIKQNIATITQNTTAATTNADSIQANSNRISNNITEIQNNKNLINQNTANITVNADSIQANSNRIDNSVAQVTANQLAITQNTNNITTNTTNIAANTDKFGTAGKYETGKAVVASTDGAAGQVLKTDGAGNLSWQDDDNIGDNLGNHTATQNLNIGSNYISADGDSEGISIDTNGKVTTSGELQVGNKTYAKDVDVSGTLRITGTTDRMSKSESAAGYSFPTNNGSSGQVLKNDGSGNLTWQDDDNDVDNLGNHTATQNLNIGSNYISADGDNEGISVDTNGDVTASNNLNVNGTTNINDTEVTGTLTVINPTNSSDQYNLPSTDGTTNQVLTTDGAGNVTWQNTAVSGPFTLSSNVISNGNGDYATNDFVVGSPTTDYDTNADHASRVYFDKSKSAFRAGYTNNDSWDDANVGSYSAAMGRYTTASGQTSTAFGDETTASGKNSTAFGEETVSSGYVSTAMGYKSIASGQYSTAIGEFATATAQNSVAIGRSTIADSHNSIAIGRFNVGGGSSSSWVATDPLFEIGNGSLPSARSNALTVYKNGNMEVQGTVKVGDYTLPDTDGGSGQVLKTDGSGALSWQDDVNTDTDNSVFSTTAGVTSNNNGTYSSDDFVFGSPSTDYDTNADHASRVYFDKSKSAFRAGYTNNDSWDDANVGSYSAAFGYNTVASGSNAIAAGTGSDATGDFSIAIGSLAEASGYSSTAIGYESIASNFSSTAMGLSTEASGHASTAMGEGTTASGRGTTAIGGGTKAEAIYSTSVGRFNVGSGNPTTWVSTDPLFEVGNGADDSNRANAMTIYKNGTTEFQSTVKVGDYTLPATDGGNGQVLKTDGAGNLSWQDDSNTDTNNSIFTNTSGVTSNANGTYASDDFVFGSPTTDYDNNLDHAYRMFYDKSKGAFRAGWTGNNNWDDANVGIYSTATGYSTLASGANSVAMGSGTIASGGRAVAMGTNTEATGENTTAFGHYSSAQGISSFATGYRGSGIGDYSTAFGYYSSAESYASAVFGRHNVGGGSTDSWVSTDPLFEVGNGTDLFNTSNAFTIYKNGNAEFQGTVKVGAYTLPATDGTSAQILTTDGSGNVSWGDASSGAFTTTSNVTSNANGDYKTDSFVFGSPSADYSTNPDHATRMYFDKVKGAVRAGYTNTDSWDEVNVGWYSTAFGNQTIAAGSNAFATGMGSDASGEMSTAIGYYTNASGGNSTAMGNQTTASGTYTTTMGDNTKAESYNTVAIGRYNVGGGTAQSWVSTDPLFEIGNGSGIGSESNAVTVYKNGNMEVQGTVKVGAYTLPATDGGSGQVLKTDGSGALTWQDDTNTDTNNSVFSIASGVTSNANGTYASDDFVFGSPSLDYDSNADHAARMFFDKSKYALRAGADNNNNWDDANIGVGSIGFGLNAKASANNSIAIGSSTTASGAASVAMGLQTTASADGSTAIGRNTEASGNNSTAMGYYTEASANYSTTMGDQTTASGDASTAMGSLTTAEGTYSSAFGRATTASSFASFTIGRFNVGGGNATGWSASDPVFEIGNGTGSANKSNALTVYKNGNMEVQGTVKVGAYTLPATDGGANQVLKTDGSGALTWQDDSTGGGGGGTPGGADTQIQYNNSGSFGGTNMSYNSGNGSTKLGTNASAVQIVDTYVVETTAPGSITYVSLPAGWTHENTVILSSQRKRADLSLWIPAGNYVGIAYEGANINKLELYASGDTEYYKVVIMRIAN